MVLYFDRPFEEVDAVIGLTKAAEVAMAAAPPAQDIQVLVIRGYDLVSDAQRQRLKELRYSLVDASGALAQVRRAHAFANDERIWRGEAFHELCFLRWLVLETVFGDEPVLAMDADVVWRVDPHGLLDAWRQGGSTLCFTSPCFAFVRDRSWYEAYRSGLERLARDPAYGSDFAKDRFKGLYHDQALVQHLVQAGELENDTANLLGHGLSERYLMTVNPLGIAPPKGAAPYSFEQRPGAEIVDGRIVPYWHMQQRFARYLWAVKAFPLFSGRRDLRVPLDRPGKGAPDPAGLMLNYLHYYLQRGDIELVQPKLQVLKQLATRAGVYEAFFNGGLARHAFTDAVWWKPRVWAQ
jgi:hypothetical protein